MTRMDNTRIPKKLLYGELCNGKRHRGRPKLRFKDVLKQSINDCNINLEDWEETAQDRSAWRYEVAQGVRRYEANRIEEAKAKRAKRKAATSIDNSSSPSPVPAKHTRRIAATSTVNSSPPNPVPD